MQAERTDAQLAVAAPDLLAEKNARIAALETAIKKMIVAPSPGQASAIARAALARGTDA